MPTITFIEADGTERTVDAPLGQSLMRVARVAGVDGIVGECGGCMNCLTCHCYVPAEVAARIPPPAADELAMIDAVALANEDSRLACQIVVTDALDGARILLPEWQG